LLLARIEPEESGFDLRTFCEANETVIAPV
jgi:hypothetical protein